jgi:hypothetical protein
MQTKKTTSKQPKNLTKKDNSLLLKSQPNKIEVEGFKNVTDEAIICAVLKDAILGANEEIKKEFSADKIEDLQYNAVGTAQVKCIVAQAELNKHNEQHRRLTGSYFIKNEETNRLVFYQMLYYIGIVLMFLAIRKINSLKNTIADMKFDIQNYSDENFELFNKNVELKEQLKTLTEKTV